VLCSAEKSPQPGPKFTHLELAQARETGRDFSVQKSRLHLSSQLDRIYEAPLTNSDKHPDDDHAALTRRNTKSRSCESDKIWVTLAKNLLASAQRLQLRPAEKPGGLAGFRRGRGQLRQFAGQITHTSCLRVRETPTALEAPG